jgi:hydrogenase/urease accessory protein HupE
MRRPRRAAAPLALALWMLPAGGASAHGTASLTVDVSELSPGHAVVHVRGTGGLAGGAAPRVHVSFDAPCAAREEEREAFEGDPVTLVRCPGSLDGARLVVEGLGPLVGEAVVVVDRHGGQRASRVLTADEPSWRLPPSQGGLALARAYLRSGFEHILLGYDHLLFLLALVLWLGRPRAVILAETAFTLSHSLSFSATALGLVHVPPQLAEALIALSLVLLALDVAPPGAAARPPSVNAWRGAAMALAFGLVHGLGFAGGLSEVGLPDRDVAAALLGFAGGIEAGQLAFLAVALGAHVLVSRGAPGFLARRLAPALAVMIGGVSSYWFFERAALCLAR